MYNNPLRNASAREYPAFRNWLAIAHTVFLTLVICFMLLPPSFDKSIIIHTPMYAYQQSSQFYILPCVQILSISYIVLCMDLLYNITVKWSMTIYNLIAPSITQRKKVLYGRILKKFLQWLYRCPKRSQQALYRKVC